MDQYVQFAAADHHANQVRTWLIRFPTSLVQQDHRFFPILSNTSFSWATSRWLEWYWIGFDLWLWKWTWVFRGDPCLDLFFWVVFDDDCSSLCVQVLFPWLCALWLSFLCFDCCVFSSPSVPSMIYWALFVCQGERESLGNNAECSFGPTFLAIFHQVLLLLWTLSSFFGKLHHGIYPILNCCWFELAIWGRAIRQSAAASCCQPKGMMIIT
jgi:hypothetical protein